MVHIHIESLTGNKSQSAKESRLQAFKILDDLTAANSLSDYSIKVGDSPALLYKRSHRYHYFAGKVYRRVTASLGVLPKAAWHVLTRPFHKGFVHP